MLQSVKRAHAINPNHRKLNEQLKVSDSRALFPQTQPILVCCFHKLTHSQILATKPG